MKKFLVLISVLAAFSTTSFAQLEYGAKLGLNFASVTDSEMGSRSGIPLGGFATYKFSDQITFQPELLYSMQGAKEKEGDVTATLKADYLDIPLMVKYYVSEGFNIQAGPQLGLLLSAKYKEEAGGQDEEIDIKDGMKGMDFGLNIGAGYDFDSNLFVDARYNMGLSKIVEEGEGKNSVVQLTVGYKF